MNDDDHGDLTPIERAAFDELTTEEAPPRILEERVIRALNDKGLLSAPRGARRRFRWTGVAAGIAAAVALFVSGVSVGQWLGSRDAARSISEARQDGALEMAIAVQRAGTAYITALTALSELADSSGDAAVDQGRETARKALYVAALTFALLVPEDSAAQNVAELLIYRPGSGVGEPVLRDAVSF